MATGGKTSVDPKNVLYLLSLNNMFIIYSLFLEINEIKKYIFCLGP